MLQKMPFFFTFANANTELMNTCSYNITEAQLTLHAPRERFWLMQWSGFEPVQGTVILVRLHMVSIKQA